MPSGVPSPVGLSQPGPLVHSTRVGHRPLLPLVTSFNPPGVAR